MNALGAESRELDYAYPSGAASALLERLCMRADIPVPELVVEAARRGERVDDARSHPHHAAAFQAADESELEAVLAHELAHLAHRDAAVMDVCSAPSRVLLGYAGRPLRG